MTPGSDEEVDSSGSNGCQETERVPERNVSGGQPRQLMSVSEFHAELARIDDVPSLRELGNRVAAMETYVRGMRNALKDQNRLAEYRIRIGRKIGDLLSQTVHAGGKSKRHDVNSIRGGSSSPLPEGISGKESSRLQHLASIPEEHLRRYLRETREKGGSITVAGFVRAAKLYDPGSRPDRTLRGVQTAKSYWARICEAVTRVMKVECCVGIAPGEVGASRSLSPREALHGHLTGKVVLRTTSRDLEPWVQELAGARQRGAVSEAILLFPARTDQPWFRLIESGGWVCCFLQRVEGRHGSLALAYHGDRRHAFWFVFRELGTVLVAPEF